MTEPAAPQAANMDALAGAIAELRPRLHRYCARMTGSVIDGEDVLQDALVKAMEAYPSQDRIERPDAWLFKIAHNTALDHLRRRARHMARHVDADPEMMMAASGQPDQDVAAMSLRTFMRLPLPQRSSVILMDVLGYSLEEVGEMTGASVAAVKATLHRGRGQLRAFAAEGDEVPVPPLSTRDRALLAAYVDRFNARDVGGFEATLAEEVRLDLVARHRRQGRPEVAKYLGNYHRLENWWLRPAIVEGRPAALVEDPRPDGTEGPYVVLLEWAGESLVAIRDFRYARYVMDGAVVELL